MYTVIYTEDFREGFVSIKVSKWVKDVEELSEIALDDPQSAYAAFTKALYVIVELIYRALYQTYLTYLPH